MTKPLDGILLLAYFRRLGFSPEAQELLTRIRASPPSRTPGARRGNMPVWYPSKKMQCIVKAESATKVELPFLLASERADDVLEIWDQPPPIPLEYFDRRGRVQHPMHTADYFLFRYGSAGWVECKPGQELNQLAEKQPNRYVQDSQGVWRCPPGEAFAKKYGLTYLVWSSDQINWAAQDNRLYLEDYYPQECAMIAPLMQATANDAKGNGSTGFVSTSGRPSFLCIPEESIPPSVN